MSKGFCTSTGFLCEYITKEVFTETFEDLLNFINGDVQAPLDTKHSKIFRQAFRIDQYVVELVTNSKHHLLCFRAQWKSVEGNEKPDARIITLNGIEFYEPANISSFGTASFFCSEERVFLGFNEPRYEEVYAAIVGIVTNLIEVQNFQDLNSINLHASCVDYLGVGVAIIGTIRAGKSAYTYPLLKLGEVRLVSDDWTILDAQKNVLGPAHAFLLRAKLFRDYPEMAMDDSIQLHNGKLLVPAEVYAGGSSRIVYRSKLGLMIILKRDYDEVDLIRPLSIEQALSILETGESMVYANWRNGNEESPPELIEIKNAPYFEPKIFNPQKKLENRRRFLINVLDDVPIYQVNNVKPLAHMTKSLQELIINVVGDGLRVNQHTTS